MSTTVKQSKEKPSGPRMLPRPTAASAARAARNAVNRTFSAPPTHKGQVRNSPSPVSSKVKNSTQSESRTEFKINRNCETEVFLLQNQEEKRTEEESNAENKSPVEELLQDVTGAATAGVELQETDNEEKKIPSTPKSRPQTPKIQSRPTTPKHPLQRNTPQSNRPNTPQQHTTAKRPRTPSTPHTPLRRPKTPVSLQNPPKTPEKEDDDIRNTYSIKQREFHILKKDLDLKQQAVLDVFDALKNIQENMLKDGITPQIEVPQELVIFNVADWTAEEISKLCRDAVISSDGDRASEAFSVNRLFDDGILTTVEAKASKVTQTFAEMCLQAFTARQELIDWIKDLLDKNEITSPDASERVAEYNSQGLLLCEALRETKVESDNAIESITSVFKQLSQERSTLVSIEESLVREVARLKQDLETRVNVVQEVVDPETVKALEEARRDLEEERTAKAGIKDKLTTTESQLRNARTRVSKMDKQLREAEASIASLTGTVKSLEDQARQREVNLEARARKLKESLKTGEVTSNQLSQQRNALQSELNELKEQMKIMDSQYKCQVEELNHKLKEVIASRDYERVILKRETELKENLEDSLEKSQTTIEELKNKIVELENSRPNPDLPTEREMDLWSELHATKDTLRIAEDEIVSCKKEKIRFLESLTKIAESDDKMGLQQKLAAELTSKEEIINKMQIQIRELTKNVKLNEQKVLQYEQYVQDLQAHNRTVVSSHDSPKTYQDLQEEVINLRMNLLDVAHRNEELLEKLAERDQQLEQQDKTSRAQARVIKVREELINMLKNKETEQSRELIALQKDLEHRMKVVDEVNKQIAAKANEIQELFSTLENKQQQIHRLEKIVLALEEQQLRSQAQRMRHEQKIAKLEHELAAGNRKERKFLFF